jgi:hypothetical protein
VRQYTRQDLRGGNRLSNKWDKTKALPLYAPARNES